MTACYVSIMAAEPLSDTSPAAARALFEAVRAAGAERRRALALSLSQTVIELSRRALRERMPHATEREVQLRWVALHYGDELARNVAAHLERAER